MTVQILFFVGDVVLYQVEGLAFELQMNMLELANREAYRLCVSLHADPIQIEVRKTKFMVRLLGQWISGLSVEYRLSQALVLGAGISNTAPVTSASSTVRPPI